MKYTFCSSAHGTVSKIGLILGHMLNLNKFKKIKIISSILSDQNDMKLLISYNKNAQKQSNTGRLNSMQLNNEWVTKEIKEKNLKIMETIKNEHKTIQNLWDTVKADLRGTFVAIQAYIKK
uniref:Uncharacterized protein n=1 Tax=Myotis myotis TaxID=51298 RepID=A0A7J7VHZ7_MYOMY|nr:hypothetical protein mMyoMyo1_008254 [Myotis myotis]